MQTWDFGPFDNEAALAWSRRLDAAPDHRRAPLVEATLDAVADGTGLLDLVEGQQAVAAAAVVASQVAGGSPVDPDHGPRFLSDGGSLDAARLADPAVRALARVVGPGSQWATAWEASEDGTQAREWIGELLRVLVPAARAA